jgi:hypothetical protein
MARRDLKRRLNETRKLEIVRLICASQLAASTSSSNSATLMPIALLTASGSAYRKPTEWQRIGNQIDAAMIFARSDFVSVQHPVSAIEPSITTSKTNGIVIFISGNFGLTRGKRLHGENCAESFDI